MKIAHREFSNSITIFSFKSLKIMIILIVICSLGEANAANSSPANSLNIGLLPHLSHKMLLKLYRPIINHIEKRLNKHVNIRTAPSFAIYMQRASQGEYDLYHTAPHMAAYSISKSNYRGLAKFDRQLHGLILVSKESSYKKIIDLRGKLVTAPDSLAVITLLGELTLKNNGLEIGKDVKVKHTNTHNNAMLAVTKGFADAAIAGVSAYKKMSPEIRNKLRIVEKTPVIPHMMFLANSKLPDGEVENLRKILLEFNAKDAGKEFFADTVFGDMTAITDHDLRRLDSVLKILLGKI